MGMQDKFPKVAELKAEIAEFSRRIEEGVTTEEDRECLVADLHSYARALRSTLTVLQDIMGNCPEAEAKTVDDAIGVVTQNTRFLNDALSKIVGRQMVNRGVKPLLH